MKISLPDGSIREYTHAVTVIDVARDISEGLARNALAARFNGSLIDITTVLDTDGTLAIITNRDAEALQILRHSTSHLLAHAVKRLYPNAKLGIGPAIESGFYYDFDVESTFNQDDLIKIEKEMQAISKQALKIERFTMPRAEAVRFMQERNEPYKVELINDLPQDAVISFYRQGDFMDLCAGPHMPSTDMIKNIKLLSNAGAYWRGSEKNKMLQRIYGTAFDKAAQLDEYLKMLEEAERRDHRRIGKELDMFSINEQVGPGLVLWHPRGARVRLNIEDFWRSQHLKNGYEIVFTPHIGRGELWETSGHLGFYKDSMYSPMEVDEQDYYVKPMNCPFHILIYKAKNHSYRNLPYRWAELGTVYRYEKSGTLHGLMRVRGFTQDDAHLICAPEQMPSEIRRVLRFCLYMLDQFGFKDYHIYVSTQPKEKSVGEKKQWDEATEALLEAVKEEGLKCDIDEGGGAFYGPKIDIKIKDALNREWQCSTIQFDFNEPERFDMTYVAADGTRQRPYMIHRALLGSIERFFGVLLEHYAGALPTWLAPEQVRVLSLTDRNIPAAQAVYEQLCRNEVSASVDNRNEKIGFKIREAQLEKIPYMLIIGDKEQEQGLVAVRSRKDGDKGTMTADEFISQITAEISERRI